MCEPLPVEAGVRAFGELEEAFVRVLARSADAVHVEVVAGLASGEQGGRLVPDGVIRAEHRPDVEHDRVLGAPVDAEVQLDRDSV